MNKHVLVLDDDIFTRKLIGMILERVGYRVTLAADTKEALQALANTPVDAITCDLMMPDKSGLEFIQYLKSHEKYASIPVVVITAIGVRDALEDARHLADAIVEKPFVDVSLRQALAQVLGETV